ncbi:hypothetical protein BHM03_00044660 [Ensete ventricosum]|uniref:Uncharacterized protein n=1 Tax=Ensete ventricosum TaxID=4639 RepID=A0A426YJB4_ENSVE|nr:hypothetical protein B296_00028840 [Ensete ventricosum]RZS13129.1 hypothetical protein BHM03_00044660 [Ensete ventricosum]
MAVVPNISPSTHRLVYAEDMTSTSMSPLRHTIFAEPINVNDSFRFQKRPHSAVDVDECVTRALKSRCLECCRTFVFHTKPILWVSSELRRYSSDR